VGRRRAARAPTPTKIAFLVVVLSHSSDVVVVVDICSRGGCVQSLLSADRSTRSSATNPRQLLLLLLMLVVIMCECRAPARRNVDRRR